MKRRFINKMIAATVISTTLLTLVPVAASAEWVNDYQGNWYYTQNGEKLTGWKKINGQVYYFDENGKMLTGWTKAGDTWCFLQSNGVLKIGWINYNKNWYYADETGAIQKGVVNISGKIYIFGDNGAMKSSNTVVNGEFYTIGSDGAVVGAKVPTPYKEFNDSGKLVQVLQNIDTNVTEAPTSSRFNEVIEDKTFSNEDPNEGRIFKVIFKDSDGAELKTKNVKYGKSVDLYDPTKAMYNFTGWNTKSDGSGKSYDSSDDIKVKGDITLYAQWDQDSATHVEGIAIKGGSYVTINKTTQLTAEVAPDNAANKGVEWSVTNGTGKATIDSNGVLKGEANGSVTVKATAKDGSNVTATKEITVTATDVVVPVSKITVNSKTGIYAIGTNSGTLQMTASVVPNDATNQDVTWSVDPVTGSASISETGLVTAISDGAVTVKATAKDGSEVVGKRTLTISGQTTKIPVESIAVSGKNGASTIAVDGGTLQMVATVSPSSASNKGVYWKAEDEDGHAIIDPDTGILTAMSTGKVMVKAISIQNSNIVGSKEITLKNQSVKPTNIYVTSDSDTIDVDGQTLQMNATVTPNEVTDKSVTWSVEQAGDPGTSMTGKASIDPISGKLTPVANGTVTVKATSKKISTVVGKKEITIGHQSIKATGVTITPDVSTFDTKQGVKRELQLAATIAPNNASNTTPGAVSWQVRSVDGVGKAEFVPGSIGLLRALANGTVVVTATAKDNPNARDSKTITISGLVTTAQAVTIVGYDQYTNQETTVISQRDGSLRMKATISPAGAASNGVLTWSVVDKDHPDANPDPRIKGTATISNGILKAVTNGEVKVKATLDYDMVKYDSDGSVMHKGDGTVDFEHKTIYSNEEYISIIGQKIDVQSIVLSAEGNATQMTTTGAALQMTATVNPTDATNKAVTWSCTDVNGAATDIASIGTDGRLVPNPASAGGTVVVKVTSIDNPAISIDTRIYVIKTNNTTTVSST